MSWHASCDNPSFPFLCRCMVFFHHVDVSSSQFFLRHAFATKVWTWNSFISFHLPFCLNVCHYRRDRQHVNTPDDDRISSTQHSTVPVATTVVHNFVDLQQLYSPHSFNDTIFILAHNGAGLWSGLSEPNEWRYAFILPLAIFIHFCTVNPITSVILYTSRNALYNVFTQQTHHWLRSLTPCCSKGRSVALAISSITCVNLPSYLNDVLANNGSIMGLKPRSTFPYWPSQYIMCVAAFVVVDSFAIDLCLGAAINDAEYDIRSHE